MLRYTGPLALEKVFRKFLRMREEKILNAGYHNSNLGKVLLLRECGTFKEAWVSFDCKSKVLFYSKYEGYMKEVKEYWLSELNKKQKVYKEGCERDVLLLNTSVKG